MTSQNSVAPFVQCAWHVKFSDWLLCPVGATKARCVVLWGPVGCGKTYGARELFRRNRVRVVEIDGDDGVLGSAKERDAFLASALSGRNRNPGETGVVFFFDNAEGHGQAAGKFLCEFMGAVGAEKKRGVVPGKNAARLVFIGNDKYADDCKRLTSPFAGKVLHIDCKSPTMNELAHLAALHLPKQSAFAGKDAARAGMALAETCGGDVRALLRAAQFPTSPAPTALHPFEVAQDLLTFPCTTHTLPRVTAVQGVLQRTNTDLVKWLVQENWPAALAPEHGWPNGKQAPHGAIDDVRVMSQIADALSVGDVFSASNKLPREYGHEIFPLHAPAVTLANARAHNNGQRVFRQRKFKLPVQSAKKETETFRRDVTNMGKAAIRQRVEALKELGVLAFHSPLHGPQHLTGQPFAVAKRFAWRERDRLVARGTVEPWGGPGALPSKTGKLFAMTGTGCIQQGDAFDPFDMHVPEQKERKPAGAGQKRKQPPTGSSGGARKKSARKEARGGKRQLQLPRMFSLQ